MIFLVIVLRISTQTRCGQACGALVEEQNRLDTLRSLSKHHFFESKVMVSLFFGNLTKNHKKSTFWNTENLVTKSFVCSRAISGEWGSPKMDHFLTKIDKNSHFLHFFRVDCYLVICRLARFRVSLLGGRIQDDLTGGSDHCVQWDSVSVVLGLLCPVRLSQHCVGAIVTSETQSALC